jgi:hypothetical protein
MSTEEIITKREALIIRLDNLEGCEDNPVYAREITLIRNEVETIDTELYDRHIADEERMTNNMIAEQVASGTGYMMIRDE